MEERCVIKGLPSHSNKFNLSEHSFNHYLFTKILSHGSKIAQVDGVTDNYLTFQDLCSKAKACAASLQHMGIVPGNSIAVISENRLEYSIVMLANMYVGSVFAPINPTYSSDEIVHVLNISKPSIIFFSAFTYKTVCKSLQRLNGISYVIVFDEIKDNWEVSVPLVKYDLLFKNNRLARKHESNDDDVAIVLTSSGTTGLPKGVMLSYGNLKYFCSVSMQPTFMNLNPNCVVLGLLPLFHGYGCGLLLACLLIGIKFVILPKFEEKLFLGSVEKYKITNLYLVPPLMVFLGRHPLVQQYDMSSVREVVCGAAPLSNEVISLVQLRLPTVDVRQGYGLTEGTIVLSITPPNCSKPQSVGVLAPGLCAMIMDIETGKPLKRGEKGEILVKGPCVMVGYCNDSDSTKQIIDKKGWLHTGDVGYVDDEGFFYIVDRIKELIKYKGFQVAPAELESLLMGLLGVKDAAVVGLPDIKAGELPIAFVVLDPNSSLTDTAIINYINGKVSPHKHLRGVRFINSIPRNPSGKILRKTLRNFLNAKL